MESSRNFPTEGKVEVDETYVDGQALGRNNGKKKLVVLAIEKKGKGVSRKYARVIETATKENLLRFMGDHSGTGAQVRTDCWAG